MQTRKLRQTPKRKKTNFLQIFFPNTCKTSVVRATFHGSKHVRGCIIYSLPAQNSRNRCKFVPFALVRSFLSSKPGGLHQVVVSVICAVTQVDWDEVTSKLAKLETDCKTSWDHLRLIVKHDLAPSLKSKYVRQMFCS